MRDFRIFLNAPLNSLAQVDILLGIKIMSQAFIDLILAFLGKNCTRLCDFRCVILCDCVTSFYRCNGEFSALVDIFRY